MLDVGGLRSASSQVRRWESFSESVGDAAHSFAADVVSVYSGLAVQRFVRRRKAARKKPQACVGKAQVGRRVAALWKGGRRVSH